MSESAPEPVPPVEGEALPAAASEPKLGLPPAVKLLAVFVLLAGSVGLLLFWSDASSAFVYSKLVHEVMKSPASFEGRELRVEGDLKPGSIQFRQEPCEWRFVLEKQGTEMPVRFPQCVVPDTFRDGMGISVTVQGKLESSGDAFLANQVVPRCPSKYEMQQRKANGEQMPHSIQPARLEQQQGT
ncbi:MAG: cytochrome c maturation protein CcmE [Myxococcales bacterium]|nr:cytochrome c maturation protein CcmE [Myxococcales bacterium]